MANPDTRNRDENLVCISADFHTAKTYDAFYREHCDALGGFTGIYGLVIEMADALTAREPLEGDDFYSRVDWVTLCEDFVANVHAGLRVPAALETAVRSATIADWSTVPRNAT